MSLSRDVCHISKEHASIVSGVCLTDSQPTASSDKAVPNSPTKGPHDAAEKACNVCKLVMRLSLSVP